jgi:hypothetical protein
VQEWLDKNQHITFHFTPVGSSWLNQVETWFGAITRQAIRRGTFASVTVLVKRIKEPEATHQFVSPAKYLAARPGFFIGVAGAALNYSLVILIMVCPFVGRVGVRLSRRRAGFHAPAGVLS